MPAQPHDGGLSLGQALFAWHHFLGHPRQPRIFSPFLGTDIGELQTDVVEREIIPGVVHVYGTARLQIVNKTEYPFFRALLLRWRQLIGVTVLLNTSFNCQELLVDTEQQAFDTWKHSGLDL